MHKDSQSRNVISHRTLQGHASWLVSFALHALVVLLAAVFWRGDYPQGLTQESSREVGIALKLESTPKRYYSESSGGESQAARAEGPRQQENLPALDDLVPNSVPSDPRKSLQASRLPALGAVDDSVSPGDGSSGITGALSGGGFGRSPGGAGSASLFGIQSPGNKFVYVFDRSGSMGGVGRTALDYAKAELIASIQSLNKLQQFQIVFYNERPLIFNPAGSSGRLSFATDENKQRAIAFIRSVTAGGGTQHDTAILLAIRLQPDVIFLLTDADEPRLSDAKLEQIHRLANGIVIHTIEFGLGPKTATDNFLSRMARQNGGQYIYIDISQALR
ncbi:MAG: vWA domain-containing protein [Thermogutta sp.]